MFAELLRPSYFMRLNAWDVFYAPKLRYLAALALRTFGHVVNQHIMSVSDSSAGGYYVGSRISWLGNCRSANDIALQCAYKPFYAIS